MVNKSRTLAVIAGIVGILLFSSKAVMVKLAYTYGVDSLSLLLLRMVFALPFFLLVAVLNKPQTKISYNDFFWLVGLGLLGYYLASYLDFLGLQFIKASLERLILFIYPTLVVIISYFVFKKKITQRQVFGILITYLGIIVIFGSELQFSDTKNVALGGILIFLSAITYASFLVGSGWLIPKLGSAVFTSYSMIVSCLAVVIHYALTNRSTLLVFSSEVYILGFLMAILTTVIPSFLISYAIKTLGASEFSIFGSLGPVSTISLAYTFLDERITVLQFIGAFVIVLGIFVAEKKIKRKK